MPSLPAIIAGWRMRARTSSSVRSWWGETWPTARPDASSRSQTNSMRSAGVLLPRAWAAASLRGNSAKGKGSSESMAKRRSRPSCGSSGSSASVGISRRWFL